MTQALFHTAFKSHLKICSSNQLIPIKMKIIMISQMVRKSGVGCIQFINNGQYRSMSVLSTYLEYAEHGEPGKVVTKREVQLNIPKPNEVLVKILAAPINPADINVIQGTYGAKKSLPAIPGNECVAEILECGNAVKSFTVGDHAIPFVNMLGTWRTHALFNAQDLFRVPKELDIIQAATMTVNPPTAYRMLQDFVPLNKGDTVIHNGANSGVGQAIFQFCKLWGINCVGVVRDRPELPQLIEYLKTLGATEILTEEQIRTTNLFKSGQLRRPQLALNTVGGRSTTELLRQLDNRGVLVTYGGMSREPVTVPTSALIFKGISLHGFWMSEWAKKHSGDEQREKMYDELIKLMIGGEIKPAVHKKVSIDDYQQVLTGAMNIQGKAGHKLIFDFSS